MGLDMGLNKRKLGLEGEIKRLHGMLRVSPASATSHVRGNGRAIGTLSSRAGDGQ